MTTLAEVAPVVGQASVALRGVRAVGSLTTVESTTIGGNRLVGFGSDAAIVDNTANLIPKRGWYDVVVHGTEDGLGFTMNRKPMSVQELYNSMLSNGYEQGTKIRLMSCYSGKLNNGAAAQLSTLAKAPVMAPRSFMVELYFGKSYPVKKL